MKKIIKSSIVVLLLAIISLSIVSCGSNEPKEEDIIGCWKIYTTNLNFHPDGTHTRSSGGNLETGPVVGKGSWSISGNTIKTYTDKYGYIDYIYKDGKLIDGEDEYRKDE